MSSQDSNISVILICSSVFIGVSPSEQLFDFIVTGCSSIKKDIITINYKSARFYK